MNKNLQYSLLSGKSCKMALLAETYRDGWRKDYIPHFSIGPAVVITIEGSESYTLEADGVSAAAAAYEFLAALLNTEDGPDEVELRAFEDLLGEKRCE